MDIDHFKEVNDTYGHEAGDQLLIDVSKRLKNTHDANDMAARFGGDEFVVLIHQLQQTYDHSVQAVKSYALRISKALEAPYTIGFKNQHHAQNHERLQTQVTCTASIGVVLFTNHNNTREALLKRADTAMYEAKRQGRNQVCLWQDSMHEG